MDTKTWNEMLDYLNSDECTKDLQSIQDRIKREKEDGA